MKRHIQDRSTNRRIWIAAGAAATLILGACGIQPTVAPTTATIVNTPEVATVQVAQPTAEMTPENTPSVESTTEAVVTPETAATVTAQPGAEQGAAMPQTMTLPGPNVTYNDIAFDLGNSPFASITVQTGLLEGLINFDSVSPAEAPSDITGTLFTLHNSNAINSNGSTEMESMAGRILVVPVSQIIGNGASSATRMVPITDTTNGTQVMTDTVMPTDVMSSDAGMMDADTFLRTLSATLDSAVPVPTSAISNSLVLTDSWLTQTRDDRVLLFQSNGKVIEFQGGNGMRFVSALNPRNSPIESNSLFYIFHGLTNDRSVYVSAIMPIRSDLFVTTAASTPIPFPLDDADGRTAYFSEILRLLDSADIDVNGTQFQVSLQDFDAIFGSLSVNPE